MTMFTAHSGLCLRVRSHVFQSVKIDVRRRIRPPPPALAMIGRCDEHGIVQKILIMLLNSDMKNATNPKSVTVIRFGLR